MGWFISLLVIIAATALLAMGLRFVESLERENRSVEEQLRTARMYDEALAERVKDMRRFRHDVNGLLQAVEYSRGAIRERGAEPGRGTPSGRASAEMTGGAFPLVDAVLDLKRHQCEEAQTAFSCEIDEGFAARAQDAGVVESDVCAIVQNLLENAYEASLLTEPASERVVALGMLVQGHDLLIVVENRTPTAQAPSFETAKPDAEQHGVGLRTVRELAGKYGGSLQPVFDSEQRMLAMRVKLTPVACATTVRDCKP